MSQSHIHTRMSTSFVYIGMVIGIGEFHFYLGCVKIGVDIDVTSHCIVKNKGGITTQQLITISQLSKGFNISTRTLRYYEQIGLIKSQKKEDYSYRVYDELTVKRLKQIIILRKLRIPLKQIDAILNDKQQSIAVEIFQQSIGEIDDEITSLKTIKTILSRLLSQLNLEKGVGITDKLLNDKELLQIVEALSVSKINFKEEKSMNDLNKANEVLSTLKDIRIVYLPPATVVSSHYIGENPEEKASAMLDKFIKQNALGDKKPDFRVYGFNNPTPQQPNETYGYELWATIPDDMEVEMPLVKKHFQGGLYAAHCIKMGDFHEWGYFVQCVDNNDIYERELREPLSMCGSMEESLNVYSCYKQGALPTSCAQLDLLIPIKEKDNV